MRELFVSMLAAVALAITSGAALSEKKHEAPAFIGDCGDTSFQDAPKNGITLGIKSLADLKGKEVGAVAGSAQDEYARHLGATTVPFQTDAEEFPSIVQGRVKIVLEDNVLFYNFMKANPTAPIEIVPNVSLPRELILGYGYGYARYATRKEDCTLRAAYTQGLAELRGDGTVSALLKKYGLDPLSNLIYFTPK